jgi:hypothetical protein
MDSDRIGLWLLGCEAPSLRFSGLGVLGKQHCSSEPTYQRLVRTLCLERPEFSTYKAVSSLTDVKQSISDGCQTIDFL